MILLSLFSISFADPLPTTQHSLLYEEYNNNRKRKKKKRRVLRKKRKANKGPMHGLAIGAGTLGGSLGYIYAPNHKISFTGQFSYLPFPEREVEINTNPYLETTLLSTLTLKGNIHPLPRLKWFHLSAGIAYSMSTIALSLPEGTHTIGTEEAVANGDGTVGFSAIQPYFGLGGGYTNKRGWGFFIDVGSNYQGAPITELTLDANASETALQAETDAIQETYNAYQFYPVIQLGATYMF
jgi:hypothetical protein